MAERRYFSTDYLTPPERRDVVNSRPSKPFFTVRGVLAASAVFAAIGGSVLLIANSEPDQSHNRGLSSWKIPTSEPTLPPRLVTNSQEYAKQLLEDPNVLKVRNVTVWGDIKEKDYKDGEVKEYAVNMRDKPYSYRTKTQQAGKVVGELPRGTMIPEAVVVFGNNPHFADRGDDAQGRWIAYLNPQDPTQIVFSTAENFRGQGVDFVQALPLGPQAPQGLTAGR